jgi:SAM-dependent methyltransferase
MKLIYLLFYIFKNYSACRILQILFAKHILLNGSVLEIGAYKGSNKNFSNFLKINNNNFFYADKKKINNNTIIDLEKKNSLKKKFDNILIFNVLEHVYDVNNAIVEIKNLLNKKGKVICSTPFLYRYHKAPDDYCRYTEDFLIKIFKENKFVNIKVSALGFGPFVAAYGMLFDLIKFLYPLNSFILIICIFFDFLLNVIFKNKLIKIYPICYVLTANKIS